MDALLAIIKGLADSAVTKFGGVWGWVISKILLYGGQFLVELIYKMINKVKRSGEQKEAKDKLDKVDKDPNSTVEDVGNAYQDAINAGRNK